MKGSSTCSLDEFFLTPKCKDVCGTEGCQNTVRLVAASFLWDLPSSVFNRKVHINLAIFLVGDP